MGLKKNILLALVLSLVAAGNLCARQNELTPDSLLVYYTDGVRLMAENEPSGALRMFERAIAIDPDHDPSLFEAANVLVSSGDYEKALGYSSRAVELDPGNNWYEGQRARILVSLERLDEALPLFEKMLGEDEFDPDNYRMLALLYYRKGRTDEALRTLTDAEVRMGTTPAIVDMKRGMLIDAGRMEEAIALTESYIDQTPFDEDNRLILAEMYAYGGRDSLAVAVLEKTVAINPDNVAALTRLSEIYRGKGQMTLYFSTVKQMFLLDEVPLDRKIEQFRSLTGSQSFYRDNFMAIGDLALTLAIKYAGDPSVAELYADHAAKSGDVDGALTILKTQLERPAPPLSTFMKVIEMEAYLKRADSVALYSDAALAIYPGETDIYLLRSSALQYMGRGKEARRTLDRALKIASTDSLRSEMYGAIGNLWHEDGNDKKAFANYERALGLDPDNALVLNNYAYYLAEEDRQLDRALGMSSRAVKLREKDPTYLDTYAWVLYKTGDLAGARRVMQQALPLDRVGNAELLFHYGEILWALGEEFMATTYWKRARDAGYEPADEIEERLSRTGSRTDPGAVPATDPGKQ